MSAQTKVKVRTAALLEAVRERRTRLIAEHESALAKQRDEDEAARKKLIAELKRDLARAEGGEYKPERYRDRVPDEPDMRPIDRLIRTLEIAADETILISADDAAKYLG